MSDETTLTEPENRRQWRLSRSVSVEGLLTLVGVVITCCGVYYDGKQNAKDIAELKVIVKENSNAIANHEARIYSIEKMETVNAERRSKNSTIN